MDLSQQELPLTAYFARNSKEARSRAVPYKKVQPTEGLQSVAHSSKRRKSNVQCSATTPPSDPAGQSKSRKEVLQLPTPAASTRKRIRSGRLELPAETPPTSADAPLPADQDAIPLSVEVESGFTPLKPLQSSRQDAIPQLPSIPLTTPSTDWRRMTKSISIEPRPCPGHSDREGTGIMTPQASSRKTSEPIHSFDNHSPLARSSCHAPSRLSQSSPELPDPEVSRVVLPLKHLARSTTDPSYFPVGLDCADLFDSRGKSSLFVLRDGPVAQTPKQYLTQSGKLGAQTSDSYAISMLPVPSSQSQYLLHLDATPKRKRCLQGIERVISSQTQEERELTMSTPHRPGGMVNLPAGVSPGSCSVRKSRHVRTLGSTRVISPNGSLASPSRLFSTTKEALDELSPKSPSPSRRKQLTSYHSPSCKARTPRKSSHRNLIENTMPTHTEDSLTESESELDILPTKTKDSLSAPSPPSGKTNQIPCHFAQDTSLPVRRGSAEGGITGTEDDSATETESDTEILHCVAEIGRKRPRDHRPEVSRKDTPRPHPISPLVSPTRPRIAPVSLVAHSARFYIEDGAKTSVSGSDAPSTQRPQIPSESLPSVVRDFIRMFPGDESYPADFPESLRV